MKTDFNWAVNKLREGKKIRRPCWGKDSYWMLGRDEKIVWCNKEDAKIHLNQINAIDWEIFEEGMPRMKIAAEIAKKFGASHVRITSIDKRGKELEVLAEYKKEEQRKK